MNQEKRTSSEITIVASRIYNVNEMRLQIYAQR